MRERGEDERADGEVTIDVLSRNTERLGTYVDGRERVTGGEKGEMEWKTEVRKLKG